MARGGVHVATGLEASKLFWRIGLILFISEFPGFVTFHSFQLLGKLSYWLIRLFHFGVCH